jgi:hypothetical protein
MNLQDLETKGNELEKQARPFLKAALAKLQSDPKVLVGALIGVLIAGMVIAKLFA